ncbi:MAG: AMP-binding protein [Pseudomonadota bacterium]
MIKYSWLNQIKRLQTYFEKLYHQNKDSYPEHLFIVAIETDNRFLIALFTLSCWKLPICLLPISGLYPDEYKNQLLKQCGIRFVFTDRTDITDFSYTILSIHQLLNELDINTLQLPVLLNMQLLYKQIKSPVKFLDENNPIKLIVTTSGTTQNPKAVYLSKNSILNHCLSSREVIKINSHSVWLNCVPLNHVAGLMILYRVMMVQGRVLLHARFDVDKILYDLSEYKISHLSLVPVMLQQLVEKLLEHKNKSHINNNILKYVVIGGSHLSQDLFAQARELDLPLIYGYGSSESCSHISLADMQNMGSAAIFKDKLSSGKVLSGVEIKIKPIALESPVGLIKYRGNMLMSGYANPDYRLDDGLDKGWFFSQDKGYINTQGELFVMGRADQIIISGAKKIHPQVIEQMMSKCPGIKHLTIYAQADKKWGQIIAMDYSGEWNIVRVKRWVEENIGSKFKPRFINKNS